MLRLRFELRDGATDDANAYIYAFQGNGGAPGVRIPAGTAGELVLLPPEHAGPLCIHVYRTTHEDAASENDIRAAFAATAARVFYSSGRAVSRPVRRKLGGSRKRFETRLGGVHIDTSTIYSMAAAAAATEESFEFRLADDALESMFRTSSPNAAARAATAYLRYQKEFTLRVTVQVATPLDADASSRWVQVYRAPWLARERFMLEKHSQHLAYRAAAEFIQHYIRAFAPFDSPDAQPSYDRSAVPASSSRDVLRFYMSEARLQSPSGARPLTPRVSRVLPMHMPTTTAPHGIMPLGLFHFRTLNIAALDALPAREAVEANARFGGVFARILEQQCVAAGLGGAAPLETFRRAVEGMLLTSEDDGGPDQKSAPYMQRLQQFYMACDALGMACAEICTHVKYRADFSYLHTGRTITVERQDVDVATGASGSGDCEDVAAAAQCIIHAILRGPLEAVQAPDPYAQHPVWRKLAGLAAAPLLRPWAPDTNLRAAQLLLCHFAPCVILGSVTDAFPGASSIVKSGIYNLDVEAQERLLNDAREKLMRRHGRSDTSSWSPAKHVAVSAAAADTLGDAELPLGTFVYDSAINNGVAPVAHQFVVLMPLDASIDMWLDALNSPADNALRTRLQEVRDVVSERLLRHPSNPLALPALVVEGTARISPYLVGASVYMDQTARLLEKNGMPRSARALWEYIDSTIVPREHAARQWRGKLIRASLWPSAAEDARLPEPKLHTRDAHHMRVLKTSIPDRRGSIFYRDALHISCPWIMTLATSSDIVAACIRRVHASGDEVVTQSMCQYLDYMTMAIVDKETWFWGVPLERLLRANRDHGTRVGKVVLRPVIGRDVPLDVRMEFYTHAFDSVLPFAPPVRFDHVRAPVTLDMAALRSAIGTPSWEGLLALDRVAPETEFEPYRTLIISAEDSAPSTGLAELLRSAAWNRVVRFLQTGKFAIVQMCYAPYGHVMPYVPAVLSVQVARARVLSRM